jgi:hypothetical protein
MSVHLVLHAIGVKKHADAAAITEFLGVPAAEVARLLADVARSGRLIEAQGKYALAPLARVALDGQYSREYADLRADADFVEAYETFERINVQLKAVITEWQTIELGGARVPNDHSNSGYDDRIIDRLGDLHDRAERVLRQLERSVARFSYYRTQLGAALEKAEDGAIEWVSDARLPSYHTLWFELHEDLLRLLGRKRME